MPIQCCSLGPKCFLEIHCYLVLKAAVLVGEKPVRGGAVDPQVTEYINGPKLSSLFSLLLSALRCECSDLQIMYSEKLSCHGIVNNKPDY